MVVLVADGWVISGPSEGSGAIACSNPLLQATSIAAIASTRHERELKKCGFVRVAADLVIPGIYASIGVESLTDW